MTGGSGAGKSTLAALLMARGWRLMGDEFALLDPATGMLHGFPRLISLKNEAIGVMEATLPDARWGPLLRGTPKGDIRHLVPDARAIAAMGEGAVPALIPFPATSVEHTSELQSRRNLGCRLLIETKNY